MTAASCASYAEPQLRKLFLLFIIKLDVENGGKVEFSILRSKSARSSEWEEEEEIMSSETKRITEQSKPSLLSAPL